MSSDWQDDALCAQTDPELFFPGNNPRIERDAKKICADCPVRQQCLELGMQFPSGIFGGLMPRERKKLRKQRAA